MDKIVFDIDSVFHSLSHFVDIEEELYAQLEKHYAYADICQKLKQTGSKFLSSFVKSPQELVSKLQDMYPEYFRNMKMDIDNRVRLSFRLDVPIGISGVVSCDELTENERMTIAEEWRNDCLVKSVKLDRQIFTGDCQLILAYSDGIYYFCTAFPGELAPPLPKAGEKPDVYWETHVFVRE